MAERLEQAEARFKKAAQDLVQEKTLRKQLEMKEKGMQMREKELEAEARELSELAKAYQAKIRGLNS